MTDDDLSRLIRSYWRERGYDVRITPAGYGVPDSLGRINRYTELRSNLVDGLPPEWTGDRRPPTDFRGSGQ